MLPRIKTIYIPREIDGVRYCVPALNRYNDKCENRQLSGKDSEESGYLTTKACSELDVTRKFI